MKSSLLRDDGKHERNKREDVCVSVCHYYVIPCHLTPRVACWQLQSLKQNNCMIKVKGWRDRHHSQLSSWRTSTVGVEESFPPPQCCTENRQLQIPMLLDSTAANTGHSRSLFLCFSCWHYNRILVFFLPSVVSIIKCTVSASHSVKHEIKGVE